MKTIKEYADSIGVEYEMLDAIARQESNNKGFRLGMPSVLFECHVFDRALRKRGVDPSEIIRSIPRSADIICLTPYKKYGSYKKQIDRFKLALTINSDCAVEACSWGKFQILGENWEMCGYLSAQEFRESMNTVEGQIQAFMGYLENKKGLIDAIRTKDWRKIRRSYQGNAFIDRNGDGKNDYEAGLIRHYTRSIQRNGARKPLHKSKTIKNNTIGAIVKAGTGGVVLGNADFISNSIAVIRGQLEQLKDVKTSVIKTSEQLDVIKDSLERATSGVAFLDWLPLFLGVALILALIPHVFVAYRYMVDNGYR